MLLMYACRHLYRPRWACCVSIQASKHLQSERSAEIKPFSAIPGPKPLPLIGNLLDIKRNLPSMRLYLEKCIKEYGGIFKLKYPGGTFVHMANPHALEAVLRAEGKYPTRMRDFDDKMVWFFSRLGYSTPLGFANDEEWKELRMASGKQTLPQNVNSYIPGMNNILQRFTSYLRANRDEKGCVKDIYKLIIKLLVELSAKFVYNKDLGVIDSSFDDKETLAFIQAVQTYLGSVLKVGISLPLFKIFPTKLYRDLNVAIKEMHRFSNKIAEELLARRPSSGGAVGLLEQWLVEGKLSKDRAIVLSIDMFTTGVDTTANTATFMLHAIATNPEVQERLHAEISSVLGDSRLPTAEDLAAMSYVKGTVKETLRLHSAAAGFPRTLKEDMVLMGYHIPAKTNVGFALYTAGRDEQLFKDADKFDPDRWSSDDINAFANLPFGFGPRSCYGRRFAELELKLILIEMARHFRLRTDQKEMPKIEETFVRPDGEIPLQLID